MIIDVNAYLGHWAFRRLRFNTAEGLLKLMDQAGIEKAAVSSLDAVTYRNAQSGNEEMHEMVERHRDRLVPLAVVNPNYAGWEDDLELCVDEWDMRGVKLHPNYHDYKLDEENAAALLSATSKRDLPVSVSIRVEDERQHHWLMKVPGVSMIEVAEAVKAFPKVSFVLNYIHFSEATNLINTLPKYDNFYIDVTAHYMMGSFSRGVGKVIERIGAEKVIFGSGMPLRSPQVALNKINTTELGEEEMELILYRNAARLLGIC